MERREFLRSATAGVVVCGLAGTTRSWWLPAAGAAEVHSVLNVVAHQDDDLLFINPEVLADIAAGRWVRTVFLTAGDAGAPSSYWLAREQGARDAYSLMVGGGGWNQGDAGVPGRTITTFTSQANPKVSLVFLRLPDGGLAGWGYGSTGNTSLQRLWEYGTGSITAVDGSNTYTRSGLISTLTALMSGAGAGVVNTMDFAGHFGDGDHSDHHATAFFVDAAHQAYTAAHTLRGYQAYATQHRPQNVFGSQLTTKQDAFYAYVAHDPAACGTPSSCAAGSYGAWLKRCYVSASSTTTGPTTTTTTTTTAPTTTTTAPPTTTTTTTAPPTTTTAPPPPGSTTVSSPPAPPTPPLTDQAVLQFFEAIRQAQIRDVLSALARLIEQDKAMARRRRRRVRRRVTRRSGR